MKINDLKMELIQVNEAIGMIYHSLDSFGHDCELVERLLQLMAERDVIMGQLEGSR